MEVSIRSERWHPSSGAPIQSQDLYVYDHAGRLNKEYADDHVLTCMYDARGNMQSARRVGSTGQFNQTYVYDGDRLKSMTLSSTNTQDIVSFAHDALGRMTFDGTTGQSMAYNSIDLVGNITGNGTTLVNYSYLSDSTKLSALDGSGEGLVYRGPFVYRKSAGSSSLTLESAAFGGGRLTPAGAMLYVRDYLGSVRAVVDGKTGQLYKAADYSAFGEESAVMVPAQGSAQAHPLATAVLPSGLTLRDGYTGKEAQDPDFSTGYTDFGARQYNPALRRWMTPDPLSEKYYGISPYAFCNNNPVNFVDPDGRRVRPKSAFELNMIKHTLPKEARNYVRLSSDGYIDYESLTQYKGRSRNFSSLISLVESETTIDVMLDNKFVYSDSMGNICESDIMSYNPPDDYLKDTSFEFTSGVTTGESGSMGKTLFPDLDGLQNSPDSNIKIIVNSGMSLLGAAETFSHEAFGHALLYIMNGGDHDGASHNNVPSKLGPYDLNFILKYMILGARRETVKNFNN